MQKPKNVIIGIYKITSPSGKVYIGQSINVEKRWNHHKGNYNREQPKLHRSFNKYGIENHVFEVIEECSIKQLDEKETFWKIHYLEQVNNNWAKVLFCNLFDTGGGPKSEEVKLKISLATKGIPKSAEARINMSIARKGVPNPNGRKPRKEGSGANISKSLIGRVSNMLGKKHSEETKRKMSNSAVGKIKSESHKEHLRIPKSEETKNKIRIGRTGKPGRKGQINSPEHRLKISLASAGRKLTNEQKMTISLSKTGLRQNGKNIIQTSTGLEWISKAQCGEYFGVCAPTINNWIRKDLFFLKEK